MKYEDMMWYRLIMPESEALKYVEPKSALDHLNKLRSDITLDNARYTRIYQSRFIQCDLQNGKPYSFNKGFDNGCYNYFISHLNNSDVQKIRQITRGDIFDESVNAQAWIDKKFGNLITINKALYYFCIL